MKTKVVFCLAAMLVASQSYGQFFQSTLWSEDFESATLGNSPEEAPAPPFLMPMLWSKPGATANGTWTSDDSGVPEGMDDWEGWAFTTLNHWIAADRQRREEFRDGVTDPVDGTLLEAPLASGIVAVADPDEWDDVDAFVALDNLPAGVFLLDDDQNPTVTTVETDPGPADALGFFNAFMTSPTIDVSSVPAGQLGIQFASSWRDESGDDGSYTRPVLDGNNEVVIDPLATEGGDVVYDAAGNPIGRTVEELVEHAGGDDGNSQTAVLSVSFDGGPSQEILRWDSTPTSPFFKDDAPNELIEIIINKPAGASSAEFEFALVEAGNDWWWAVDNIFVGTTTEVIPEPTSMALCGLAMLAAGSIRRRS